MLTQKYIILGLVAIAFVAGTIMTSSMAYAANGQPFEFLQEQVAAIELIIQDLQDQLNNIHVDWTSVTDIPAGFADDIDNDLLSEISTSCTVDQIPKWDGNQWVCTNIDTISFMDCTIDQIVKWNGNQWVCTDSASDSLAGDFALRKVDCNIIGELLELSIQFDTRNGCNLVDVGLDDIEIPGANLSLADLTEAVFDEANLADVDFSGANLSGVDFYGSNLSGAIFTGAFADPPCYNNPICATLPTS